MVFGLGSKKSVKSDKTSKKKQSDSQSEEAAKLLKKMEDKKEAGDCPFC